VPHLAPILMKLRQGRHRLRQGPIQVGLNAYGRLLSGEDRRLREVAALTVNRCHGDEALPSVDEVWRAL